METYQTVIARFEEQVRNSPEQMAVEFGSVQMTYHELNQKANQLAHYLTDQSIPDNKIIGLCLERGLNLIISVVGHSIP